MAAPDSPLRRWLDRHHGAGAQPTYRADVGPFPVKTFSGLPLQALYGSEDVDKAALEREAYPGSPPFTRGIHSGMYRQRLWTIRQYSGFASAAETNARWKELLKNGVSGLSTAFDLPTQLGLDPDDPRARGEVGRVGVPVPTVEDMHRLFEDIDVGAVSVSMTINAPAAVLVAFLQVVAEERGVDPAKLRGTVQNDILKEYAARNNYIYPPLPSMLLAVDVLEHCATALKSFYPISISGYHVREAGCTAPQEIAFTLSNGLGYLNAAVARGLDPIAIGRQLSFFFASATDLIEEVAKFRAARRLWTRLLQERLKIADEKALQLRFHVQTMGSLLTSQQPENNLVRVGIQGLAAVLGGCQSLHTNAYDEAIGLPGPISAKLAVATQQILAFESGIANIVDPLGGSYCVEALTDALEHKARTIIAEIDQLGGAMQAVESGYYKRRIADAAFQYQREVESGVRKVVGVNAYVSAAPAAGASIQNLRPEMEADARRSLESVRAKRNAGAAIAALAEVERAAREDRNRMNAILAAARARCSVGEICGALRRVYGEYKSV